MANFFASTGIIVKKVRSRTNHFIVSIANYPPKSLCESNLSEGKPEFKLIEQNTKAIFFLGTPHRGSPYASLGKIAETIASAACFDTNGKTIGHLEVHGEQLMQLEKDFGRLVAHQTFLIHNFQEAQGFKGIKGLNGRVSQDGLL